MSAPCLEPDILLTRAKALGEQLAAEAAEYDRIGKANFSAFERISHLQLGALRVPREYGGAGGTMPDLARLVTALAQGDPSVAQAMLPHFVFVERTRLMATPAQCDHFLSQVAQGILVGGASAELGGQYRGEVRTRLRRSGDAYRLSGEKHYSTGALMGQLLKVLALDDDDQSVLVVIPSDRAGVVRHDDWSGMGQRGTLSGRTELHQVRVDEQEIMRVHPWQQQRHHTGSASQIIHCAIEVGIAQAALADAAGWARSKVRAVRESGQPQGNKDPYLLHKVGEIAARTHSAEALVLLAAEQVERAGVARFAGAAPEEIEQLAIDAAVITAEAKAIATEAALFACQTMFDVGGASMTLRQHGFDRHWRNARTHTTHDPIAWKYRAIGDYRVNHRPPPISYLY
ncbi:acyl-CoA dehydrogenase family protein [Pantoea cypripedii]|uniref:Dehydrogenase n=1 Tax=Pantoea cypripedii TaxID=55209 RepID=A0A6B9G9R1_PANCY|nr:acyl-CoA dehydrogenase family protein [Pantoea cypripedii]QGY32603.1 dehydrogenase [Pantoea cypripedii]